MWNILRFADDDLIVNSVKSFTATVAMGHLLSKSTAAYLIFNAPRGFAQRHKNVVDTLM